MTSFVIEAVARALYRMNGHPTNSQFESEPMWQRYIMRAEDILDDVRDSVPDDADPVIWRLLVDAVLAANDPRAAR